LLANRLEDPAIWFTALGNGVVGLVNGFAEITNELVALAIWFTGLAIRFAGLVN